MSLVRQKKQTCHLSYFLPPFPFLYYLDPSSLQSWNRIWTVRLDFNQQKRRREEKKNLFRSDFLSSCSNMIQRKWDESVKKGRKEESSISLRKFFLSHKDSLSLIFVHSYLISYYYYHHHWFLSRKHLIFELKLEEIRNTRASREQEMEV